jgi:organic hydroperoxide reductase OsmC/OhrA
VKGPVHEFRARLLWTGASDGPTRDYRGYSRRYRVDFEGKPSLDGSAAPAFRGDPALHNPEDLLVASLSACHCLSYLALAARGGIEVVAYEDEAHGTMAMVDGGLRFTRVILRPTVTIMNEDQVSRAGPLHREAHEVCFIARSVAFPVETEPTIVVA